MSGRIDAAFICDSAKKTGFGTLHAQGIRREVQFEMDVPLNFDLTVAVHLTFDVSSRGSGYRVEFRFVDPDGKVVVGSEAEGQIPADLPAERPIHTWHVFTIENAPVTSFGDHVVELDLDGHPESRLPFFISRAERAPRRPDARS